MLRALNGVGTVPLLRLFELRNKVAGALDRSCNKLREEGHEEREEEEILLGLDVAPIYVDNVGEGLERVKRNAYGENKIKGYRRGCSSKVRNQSDNASRKEVEVFIEEQNAKAHYKSYRQPEFSDSALRCAFNNVRCHPGYKRSSENKEYELCLVAHIEVVARNKEHRPLKLLRQNEVKQENYRIEE